MLNRADGATESEESIAAVADVAVDSISADGRKEGVRDEGEEVGGVPPVVAGDASAGGPGVASPSVCPPITSDASFNSSLERVSDASRPDSLISCLVVETIAAGSISPPRIAPPSSHDFPAQGSHEVSSAYSAGSVSRSHLLLLRTLGAGLGRRLLIVCLPSKEKQTRHVFCQHPQTSC